MRNPHPSLKQFYNFIGTLVHRFVNNYTNRVGCGFECAGLKTQA